MVGGLTSIKHFYVCVNDYLYEVASIVLVVKLALAVFFSLDCKYPQNTETNWVLLQRIFTNIQLPSDILTIQVNVILGHIKELLKADAK